MDKRLKGYDDLFAGAVNDVIELKVDELIPFDNHPFILYTGERLEDMKRSIRDNGVMVPIIVRAKDGEYQILAGHNRVNASKAIGLDKIPAVIFDHVNDEEALMIVTETNFIQRSFSDMAPSEKAKSLMVYYDSLKRQGKRTDLLETTDKLTCTQNGNKLRSLDKVGKEYGLSKNSISRILRLNYLIPELLTQVDDGQLPMMAAVHLSFLDEEEQRKALIRLFAGHKISVSDANSLKKQLVRKEMDKKNAEVDKKTRKIIYIISEDKFLEFFRGDEKATEVNEVITNALEMYYGAKK